MNNEKPKTALAQLMDSVPKIRRCNIDNTTAVIDTDNSSSSFMVMQSLHPEECRPWAYADRPEEEMGDIHELAESIKKHGQQEPILVRHAAHANGEYHYEIIFGSRRWRACQEAGVNIIAIVKPLSDQQAALYQKEENENRTDLSDLSRARSYKRHLDAGIFSSEKELSDVLCISKQNLNDIMAYTRLPDELVEVLPNLNKISRKTVVKISVLAKEKIKLKCLISLASKIDDKKITSSNIEKYIDKALGDRHPGGHQPPETMFEVKDADSRILFTMKQTVSGDTIIRIHRRLKSTLDLKRLRDCIFATL